jgi:hypothetical protein
MRWDWLIAVDRSPVGARLAREWDAAAYLSFRVIVHAHRGQARSHRGGDFRSVGFRI